MATRETVAEVKVLKRSPTLREDLCARLHRYLDLPLALASILMVLLAVIQLTGEVSPHWHPFLTSLQLVLWGFFVLQFLASLALAPRKTAFLRQHWLDVLVVLVPFVAALRILAILRATPALPLFRLVVFGSAGLSAPLRLIQRRHLGQLLLISVLVIFIGAALGLLTERHSGSGINDFGNALWWSATTVSTIGSQYNPLTLGGRLVGYSLMLYGLGVFTYVTASIASVLVGIDQDAGVTPAPRPPSAASSAQPADLQLTPEEVATLRAILARVPASTASARESGG